MVKFIICPNEDMEEVYCCLNNYVENNSGFITNKSTDKCKNCIIGKEVRTLYAKDNIKIDSISRRKAKLENLLNGDRFTWVF